MTLAVVNVDKLASTQSVQGDSDNWYLIQNLRKIIALAFRSVSPK